MLILDFGWEEEEEEVGRYRWERSQRDEEGMPRRAGTSEPGDSFAVHWRAAPAVQRYL